VGPAAVRQLPLGDFLHARLVPICPVPGTWLISGAMSSYPKAMGPEIAQIVIDLATRVPELAFRNPVKIELGWRKMREQRAAFVEFFGTDELVLPPAIAEERLNAYYQHGHEGAPFFELPAPLKEFATVGVIFDDVDGLHYYTDYGKLQDLFANPVLATDKRYTNPLRAYLREKSISPLPLIRIAEANPDTVDAV
jgi:hypothetical protein